MRPSFFLIGLITAGLSFAAEAQEKILVQDPAAYEANSPITELDRLECTVAHRLARSVLERVRERYAGSVPAENVSKPGSDWGLGLVITNLNGIGEGGPARGLKYGHWSVTVRAELYHDSKLVTSKSIKRATVMGQGTCAITERIVKVLGKDVTDWLEIEIKTRALTGSISNRGGKT
jgi:hypothetical protein